MLGASFLPARFRTGDAHSGPSKQGYVNRKISPLLESLSQRACSHPIHTIVFVALLASTSYIGLLEGRLFEHGVSSGNTLGGLDFTSLVEGSRRLRVGEDTAWKWRADNGKPDDVSYVHRKRDMIADIFYRALITLGW